MEDAAQALTQCKRFCDEILRQCESAERQPKFSAATLGRIQAATAALAEASREVTSGGGQARSRPVAAWRRSILRRSGWLLFYAATIAGILWWYEIRPGWQAHRRIQGIWQFTEGVGAEKRLDDTYYRVAGSRAHLYYASRQGWQGHGGEIRVRPARDFFVVSRFDLGGRREMQYILRVADDRLHRVRGVARLDPMMERRIDELRRVERLPPELRGQIESAPE